MRVCRRAAGTARDPFQFALERPGAGEETAVELVEITARRKEHEAARNADGEPDGAAVELDRKTLAWHFDFSNACRCGLARRKARAMPV